MKDKVFYGAYFRSPISPEPRAEFHSSVIDVAESEEEVKAIIRKHAAEQGLRISISAVIRENGEADAYHERQSLEDGVQLAGYYYFKTATLQELFESL